MSITENKKTCGWPGDDPLMIKYHDEEWGVPVTDDKKIFEFLVLESAQAGLSWRTILHKREGYRKLFAGFEVKKVAKFGKMDVGRLVKNPAIIRNRLKILATINNVQRFLEVQKEFGSFSEYMWSFKGEKDGEKFSKDLKSRGFKFLGPTVVYAHMQAVGMVNDHVVDCFRYNEIRKIH